MTPCPKQQKQQILLDANDNIAGENGSLHCYLKGKILKNTKRDIILPPHLTSATKLRWSSCSVLATAEVTEKVQVEGVESVESRGRAWCKERCGYYTRLF